MDADVIDWPRALETVQGDRDLLREVARAFLSECPLYLSELTEAVEQKDLEEACRLVHRIRGVMLALAISTETAQEVEDLFKDGDVQAGTIRFQQLRSQLERAIAVLTEFEQGNFEPE